MYPSSNHLAAVALSAALCLVHSPLCAQSVETAGDVSPSPADSPNWTVNDDLQIGITGTGSMTVEGGGSVTSNNSSTIGSGSTGVGAVTVTGIGSSWSTNGLDVGGSGTGTLDILDGGQLSANSVDTFIGDQASGSGKITVSGSGSQFSNSRQVFVGSNGTGSILIEAGGTMATTNGVTGIGRGSGVGDVTVTGPGSSWAVRSATDSIIVGDSGHGTLNVTDGANVILRAAFSTVGYDAGSSGKITVSGSGSQFVSFESGGVTVGRSGTGSILIGAGGSMLSQGLTSIGSNSGGVGDVTVTGTGSSWVARGGNFAGDSMAVGGSGRGTLNVADGASVSVTSGNAFVGFDTGASGEVVVTGQGSSLTGNWTVGLSGTAALTVTEGGFFGGNLHLAANAGSTASVKISDGGIIGTGGISVGAGLATMESDGGILQPTASTEDFLSGFAPGGVTLHTGGLTFDTAFSVGVSLALGGEGGLTKSGTGSLTLTGENFYAGRTTITSGTLQLGNGGTTGSVSGGITDNGTLVINRSDDLTLGTAISGSGNLVKLGTNTLTLITDETYGGVTTIASGTLQLGSGGTTGRVAGDIENNGALTINRSNDLALNGKISGTGGLTQLGGGQLTLTADETYSGVTTIASGTLQLGDGGTKGSVAGDIVDHGTLVINRSNDFTLNQEISGTGNLVKNGSGLLTLSGSNTFAGGVVVNSGTLNVLHGGGLWTGSVSVQGASLQVDALNLGSLPGRSVSTVSGSTASMDVTGQLTIGASGTAVLSLVNGAQVTSANAILGDQAGSAGGVTLVGANSAWTSTFSLIVGNEGQGDAVVTDGGRINTRFTSLGQMEGGSGTVLVTGSGATWTSTTLVVGLAGSGTMTVQDGAVVNSTSGTIGEASTGSGEVTVSGSGSLWSTTSLTVGGAGTGSLTIADGGKVSLQIFQLSVSGSGSALNIGQSDLAHPSRAGTLEVNNVGLAGGATINFNQTDQVTFAQKITGDGRVVQRGSGTTRLMGLNTYTGETIVSAGVLTIVDVGAGNSVLGTGDVTVASGGTLAGDGTVLADTAIFGTLEAGTLHFTKNFALVNTGTLKMELNSLTDFSSLTVDGAMLYDGILILTLADGYRPQVGDEFALFHAGEETGSFNDIEFNVGGYAATFDYGTGLLEITAVPEPSTLALGLMGSLALWVWWRRKSPIFR